MNKAVIRSNRINDLFKYAIKLAQDNTETVESIHRKVMDKALILVSKPTAIEYVGTVFARIDRLREQ